MLMMKNRIGLLACVYLSVFLMNSGCKESKCVDGNNINEDICREKCENETTADACMGRSLPDPDWADFGHGCVWMSYTEASINGNGTCEFGETVGRCEYEYGGLESEWIYEPLVLCGDRVIPQQVLYAREVDGETWLALTYAESNRSDEVLLWCDPESPDYSPYCQCPCMEDSPFEDKAIHSFDTDYADTEDLCESCTAHVRYNECTYVDENCMNTDSCRFLLSDVDSECAIQSPGSTLWLECVAQLESGYSANAVAAFRKLFVCEYCTICADYCPNAPPACDLWDSNQSK